MKSFKNSKSTPIDQREIDLAFEIVTLQQRLRFIHDSHVESVIRKKIEKLKQKRKELDIEKLITGDP